MKLLDLSIAFEKDKNTSMQYMTQSSAENVDFLKIKKERAPTKSYQRS